MQLRVVTEVISATRGWPTAIRPGPVARCCCCCRESTVSVTALRVGTLASDLRVEVHPFELLRSATAAAPSPVLNLILPFCRSGFPEDQSVPVRGGNPDTITPSRCHNPHSPGLAAREAQVTFLALPRFHKYLTAEVWLELKSRGGGGPGMSRRCLIMEVHCKVYCRSIKQCYIAATSNNGRIVSTDFTQTSV